MLIYKHLTISLVVGVERQTKHGLSLIIIASYLLESFMNHKVMYNKLWRIGTQDIFGGENIDRLSIYTEGYQCNTNFVELIGSCQICQKFFGFYHVVYH